MGALRVWVPVACHDREMASGTVLVVDDEANIAELVELYLRQEGFRVVTAGTGEEGLKAAETHRPRLIVLDVGLPDMDGIEVCRRLRAVSQVPVIFLTARDGEVDRVLGLEMGADDYVTKPFSPRELIARVKTVLRRMDGPPTAEVIEAGSAVIDIGRREVRNGEEVIPLTTKEFDLLVFFAERRTLALSRQQILDAVWGHGWYGDARTVDVHVAQLRKKLGGAATISTVWGVGYRFEKNPEKNPEKSPEKI